MKKKITLRVVRAEVNSFLGAKSKSKTTTKIEVSLETAEFLKEAAKEGRMKPGELIQKLLKKLME